MKSALRRYVAIAAVAAAFAVVMVSAPHSAPSLKEGTGDIQLVAMNGQLLTGSAALDEINRTQDCCRQKWLFIDAKKMPFIARNIALAFKDGKPLSITRASPGERRQNWQRNCGNFQRKYADGSCDEYPFASTVENRTLGARIAEVPTREQNCQGGTISSQYRNKNIVVGEKYGVVILNPQLTPQTDYQGADLAPGEGDQCAL